MQSLPAQVPASVKPAWNCCCRGATVVGCGRRQSVDDVLGKVTAAGGKGMVVSADLAMQEQAQHVIDETVKAYGRVDIWFTLRAWMELEPRQPEFNERPGDAA